MPDTPAPASEMTPLRGEIDALDRRLVGLLAERAALIDRAAAVKSAEGLPARIDARVEEVVARVRREAGAVGVDPDLVETLWRRLIEWSIDREEATLGRGE